MPGEIEALEVNVAAIDGTGRVFPPRAGLSYRIKGALPGDRIVPLRTTQTGNRVFVHEFARAAPTPMGRPAPCPAHGACGGCPLMELKPEAQREAKLRLVFSAFQAQGIELTPYQLPRMRSGHQTGYRRRIRMRVGQGLPTFFNPNKPIDCGALSPALEHTCRELAKAVGRTSALSAVEHLEVRAPDHDGAAGLFVSGTASHLKGLRELLVDWKVGALGEEAFQRYQDTGTPIYVPLSGFLQVNQEVNRLLVASILAGTEARGLSSFVDLFSGAGNFSIPLLLRGLSGQAVESHGPSVRALRRTLTEVGASMKVLQDDASRLCAAGELLILNPPRSGVRGSLADLIATGTRAVAYVACNPFTLARDLAPLLAKGAHLESLECFDMFPETAHVETLAWLHLNR